MPRLVGIATSYTGGERGEGEARFGDLFLAKVIRFEPNRSTLSLLEIREQLPTAVALTTSQRQRHAYLLGRVFSIEGIVRLLAAML